MGTEQPASVEQPTRVRYGVLGFLCSLAFVLYIDRICIGQAGTRISEDLGFTKTQMGFVYGSFMIAYGLFEVITGHWGDRFGSRRVLIRIVLWWSAFTALTACVFPFSWSIGPFGSSETRYILFNSFALMLLVRFLFGAGEAGALPNAARVISRWFPIEQRSRAQSLITTCNLIGGSFAPLATAWLIRTTDWRWVFVIYGSLGVIWAIAFSSWFRDEPTEHPSVNAAERDFILSGRPPDAAATHHDPIPWRQVLSSGNTWFLGCSMTCSAFYAYMLYSWFPTYLKEARSVSELRSGFLSAVVLLCGACGVTLGGWMGDRISVLTGSRRQTLRFMGVFGLALGAPCVGATVYCDSPVHATLLFAAACFLLNVQLAAWWSAVADVSGRHLGALFGLMNSMGIVGGLCSQIFLGWFVDQMDRLGYEGRDRWDPAFLLYSGVLLLGGLLWAGVNVTKPIVKYTEESTAATEGAG